MEAEKIGYLIAKIEDLCGQVEKVDSRLSTLETTVYNKFKTAELTFKIFRFLGLAALAVLSFQFGDITRYWHYVFSG